MSTTRRRAIRIAVGALAGLVAGAVTAMSILLIGTAVFWLYVFGDDPWPSAAETALVATAFSGGTIVFLAILVSQARARA